MQKSDMGISADLGIRPLRAPKPYTARSLKVPFLNKRIILTSDPGQATILASDHMQTNLWAIHRDGDHKVKDAYDLGSGNVQTNLVVGLMQDVIGTTNDKAAPVFATLKYMYSGTGSTVNTYDFQLATTAGPASGLITPTLGYATNNSTLQWVGTIAYTTSLAITEWGLFNNNVQGAQSTSATNTWNAQGQASATWGTTLGAGANAFAGYVAVGGTVGMFIISNSLGTAGTIIGAVSPTTAFYNLTAGGGSATTPSSNTSTSIYPLMGDHKSFSAINVINGDSIQFTYTLTLTAGS